MVTKICGNKANVSEPAKDNFVDGKKDGFFEFTPCQLYCGCFAKR